MDQISCRSLIRLSVRDLDVCNVAFELAWIDLFLKPESNKRKNPEGQSCQAIA